MGFPGTISLNYNMMMFITPAYCRVWYYLGTTYVSSRMVLHVPPCFFVLHELFPERIIVDFPSFYGYLQYWPISHLWYNTPYGPFICI
jgi:hypothetical protein